MITDGKHSALTHFKSHPTRYDGWWKEYGFGEERPVKTLKMHFNH